MRWNYEHYDGSDGFDYSYISVKLFEVVSENKAKEAVKEAQQKKGMKQKKGKHGGGSEAAKRTKQQSRK